MKQFSLTANQNDDNLKLEAFLKKRMRLSKVIINKVKLEMVYINKKHARLTDLVFCGDEVTVTLPPDKPNEFTKPLFVNLDVVYEDDYIIAVNKPASMLVHNSKNNSLPSLENALCGYFYPNPFVLRAINRLDRDTSGIVIVAKDCLTASILGEQMKHGDFKKSYLAVIVGKPKNAHGFIDAPIKRENSDSMKRIVAPDGKNALTEYFYLKDVDEERSLVEVILHTGRTHQIRVHFAHVNTPLYADALYGKEVFQKSYILHASKIEFTHPFFLKAHNPFGAFRHRQNLI